MRETRWRGLRVVSGDWKTIWMALSTARGRRVAVGASGLPSSATVPAEGGTSPATTLAKVDLPDPLSPTSPTVSPRRTARSIPRSTRIGPKLRSTPALASSGAPSAGTATPAGGAGRTAVASSV